MFGLGRGAGGFARPAAMRDKSRKGLLRFFWRKAERDADVIGLPGWSGRAGFKQRPAEKRRCAECLDEHLQTDGGKS